jgi:hypothetical protein
MDLATKEHEQRHAASAVSGQFQAFAGTGLKLQGSQTAIEGKRHTCKRPAVGSHLIP